MASVSKSKKNGTRVLQFSGPDGKRQTLRLGRIDQKQAIACKLHVERLINAAITQSPPPDATAHWLKDLEEKSPKLLQRLAKMSLCELPEKLVKSSAIPLRNFLDDYIATFGPTVKPATVTTWKQARRLALEFFDANMPIAELNEGKAIEFRSYLVTRERSRIAKGGKLSESTVRRRCGCLHQMFDHAVSLELITKNPFDSKRVPKTLPRPDQKFFVTPAMAESISAALPSAEWRLLFSLARWGALRVPSEPRLLTWTDVDWGQGRLTVHSPKTEHHEGHDRRTIPLFPELRAALNEIWNPEVGSGPILPMMQGKSDSAFRKPLINAIVRAGLKPWEKLWTSLRATRDTELRELFPSHVCDAWVGHAEGVAKKNYLQVVDQHFEKACSALHNPTQHTAATRRNDAQTETAITRKHERLPLVAAGCGGRMHTKVGDEGLEISHDFPGKTASAPQSAVESDVIAVQEPVPSRNAISQAISLANSGLPAAASGEALAAISCWIRHLAQLHKIEASIDSQATLCQVVDALVDGDALSRTQAAQVGKMVAFLSACVYGAPRSSQGLSAILESAADLLQGK